MGEGKRIFMKLLNFWLFIFNFAMVVNSTRSI